MNLLHEKRRLAPYGGPLAPISAAVAAFATSLGASATVATIAGTMAVGATVGMVGAAITGGDVLKGALLGAVTAGVVSGVTQAIGAVGAKASTGVAGASQGGAVALAGQGAPVFDASVQRVIGGVAQAPTALTSAVGSSAATGTALAPLQNYALTQGTGLTSAMSGGGLKVAAPGISVDVGRTALAPAVANTISSQPATTGLLSQLGDKTVAAGLQVGGQMLSGVAQSKAADKRFQKEVDLAAERRRIDQQDARFGRPVGRGLLALR